jgi:uncharacterized membrane protein
MDWTIGNALKAGFALFKERWPLWIGVTLFTLFLPWIPKGLEKVVSQEAHVILLVLIAISVVFGVLVDMGFNTLALKAARGEPYQFSDFFSRFHLFPSYFWAHILNGLAIIVGLALLIIPGIWIATKFSFYRFYVLDKGVTGVEALKQSSQLAEGSKWRIFLFMVAAVLINILGLLAFGIGFLVTVPWIGLAWTTVYITLKQQKETT